MFFHYDQFIPLQYYGLPWVPLCYSQVPVQDPKVNVIVLDSDSTSSQESKQSLPLQSPEKKITKRLRQKKRLNYAGLDDSL
jgi:hypothetical protein